VISGNPKYVGITVGEFSVNLMDATVKMRAKAAFVDPRTGATHGWTEGGVWSPDTILKMRELVAAMELDLSRQHFTDGATSSDSALAGPPGLAGGLGEHVGSDGDQV
jgi:hypothetical protein